MRKCVGQDHRRTFSDHLAVAMDITSQIIGHDERVAGCRKRDGDFNQRCVKEYRIGRDTDFVVANSMCIKMCGGSLACILNGRTWRNRLSGSDVSGVVGRMFEHAGTPKLKAAKNEQK